MLAHRKQEEGNACLNSVRVRINILIVQLDQKLGIQLDAIVNHPKFLALEASWKALYDLAEKSTKTKTTLNGLIKILNISSSELKKDLSFALEYDQSSLFQKIYSSEFDHPGGQPFGILLGNYYYHYTEADQTAGRIDGLVLREMAKIAKVAFAPFITGVAPDFFGISKFSELHKVPNIENLMKLNEYQNYHRLRADSNCQFIGLIFPEYQISNSTQSNKINRNSSFLDNIKKEKKIWVNPVYFLAKVLIHHFAEYNWFLAIQGFSQEKQLRFFDFSALKNANLVKSISVKTIMTESMENQLNQYGFSLILQNNYSKQIALSKCPSIYFAKTTLQSNPTNLSPQPNMMHHILCVSRFVHYIKIIMREKIGSFMNLNNCEEFLRSWLYQYTSGNSNLPRESIAKYPLRFAHVKVFEMMNQAGHLHCQLHLGLHGQNGLIETQLQFDQKIQF